MPSYDIHKKIGFIVSIIIGIILTIFFIDKLPLIALYFILPVILLYSNLPDLDHHLGRLRRIIFKFIFFIMAISVIVAFFINIWLMLGLLTLTGIAGLLLLKIRHRGPLHTYLFVFLASIPLSLIHWLLFVLAFSCSASHIFVDRLFSKTKRKAKKLFGIKETHNIIFRF